VGGIKQNQKHQKGYSPLARTTASFASIPTGSGRLLIPKTTIAPPQVLKFLNLAEISRSSQSPSLLALVSLPRGLSRERERERERERVTHTLSLYLGCPPMLDASSPLSEANIFCLLEEAKEENAALALARDRLAEKLVERTEALEKSERDGAERERALEEASVALGKAHSELKGERAALESKNGALVEVTPVLSLPPPPSLRERERARVSRGESEGEGYKERPRK